MEKIKKCKYAKGKRDMFRVMKSGRCHNCSLVDSCPLYGEWMTEEDNVDLDKTGYNYLKDFG